MAVGSNDGSQELQLNDIIAEDSMDFEAWIALISTVESLYNDNIDKLSLLYDSFLSEFPLCYGYWKKYAEHHARLCSVENAVKVFEKAIGSVPYSVGVWVDYCSFSISTFEEPSDVCRLFERGLSFVGKDYLCTILWDKYIEFEYSQQHWNSLAAIYLQTLKFPTKKLHQYYESFKKLVSIWEEEIRFQEGSHAGLQSKYESYDESMVFGDAEISHVVSDLLDQSTRAEALQKYRSIGEFFYQKARVLDAKVRKFEQNIHRPYFHVKPLNDSQLQNWHWYLDFVEMEGDFEWAVKLYERCLVPCAHYPEFWMRYVDFMESKGGKEICDDALDRATSIFLKNSPEIHLFNAWFKEKNGDFEGANVAVLQCDQDIGSHFIDLVRRKANMEKRMGNYDKASQTYKDALDLAKLKRLDTIPKLYVHYARLQYTITYNVEAAREILLNGIECRPHSKLLLKELLSFSSMHAVDKQVDHLDSIIARVLTCGSDVSGALSNKDRERISTLYLEFIDSCGSINDIRRAWNRHLKLFPHLVRVHSPLKKSPKAGAILQMVAEGRPEFFNHHFRTTSMDEDENHFVQPPDPKEKFEVMEISDKDDPVNRQAQLEQGDERLASLEVEQLKASKSHKNDKEAVDVPGSNSINTQKEFVAQQEMRNSQDGILSNPQNDASPYGNASKAPAVEAPSEVSLRYISSQTEGQDTDQIPVPSPAHLDNDEYVDICNGSPSPSPSSTRRRKDSSPISSPPRPSDREGSRFRPNSSRGRSDYGSPVNSGDRRDRSLSPRRRNSHGYSDRRYNRQRSGSPRRYNSRWNSEDRWNRERNQRRYSRYPDNSRGNRDGRTQNHHIVVVDNKDQPHNVQQHQSVGSAPQSEALINQYPVPNNEQYADVHNTQLYNQMWQYYYQQQQLLLQQQPASQQPQSHQMSSHQQNPGQQQHTPTGQQIPTPQVPGQQQLLQLHYQQQLFYQQQLLQQQTNEQIQLPQQQLYQTLPLQQLEQQQQQQQQAKLPELPQMQQPPPPQLQQQQSYQHQELQKQQYLVYLQQLHQYQQSQQQPGLVQDQTIFLKPVELLENQQDQQLLLPSLQHKKEDLSSQKDDGPSEVNSMKGNHDQNPGIDHHASTSGATRQLKSEDQLPEIE